MPSPRPNDACRTLSTTKASCAWHRALDHSAIRLRLFVNLTTWSRCTHSPELYDSRRSHGYKTRRISLILPHERNLGGGFRNTARWFFHCQQSSGALCSSCFCPLILDHGVCLIISISGLKILHSQILLDTSFYHCLQSVIIKSSLLLMNLHIVQFPIRSLSFSGLSYSEFVQSFQDVIRWDFCH